MPISLLLLLAITFTLSTSSAVVDASFSDCNRTFSCGPINNLTYPFTGADRPAYCGLPELQLKCPNDNTTHPKLTINSVTYQVLEVHQTLQTLILVNSDLYNNTCPQKLTNSTPNSSIFNPGADNVNLTLFYGCPSPIGPPPPYMFTCDGNGVRGNAFFFIGLITTNQLLNLIGCDVSLVVPVLKDVGDRLIQNLTSLRQVLTSGFNVNFRDPYSRRCSNCTGSGGQCGVELDNSKFVCFTPDSNSSSNPKTLHIVFPVIGAIFAGIGIGWLIFFCRQRRKRRLAAQNESKDVLTDSTKGLFTTSSTNFTQSIPSYPSLKSMVGKGSTYFGAQIFSYTELEQATDNFSPSKELGEGGFGTVYYGTLHDGRVVAVKRLYENNFKRLEQFMNEVEILTRLQHVNLVKLYGCTSKRSRELLLVYEYIPNGTVADHLHGKQASSGFLSWPVRMNIAIETAEALAYLHASDIIHRDVKTNNILLDKNFCVKVADFGLSRLFPNDATHVSTAPQGTPGYVDPEYYRMYKLTDKSDVYSFGVVLIELISSLQAVDTNRHRHDINLANMAINKIQNQSISELVDQNLGYEADASVRKMTIMVAELAFRCLQEDNDMRPSMKEVVDTLRSIQNEKEFDARKVEALEILADDSAPLKGKDCPISPDSVADKWISSKSTSISSG